MVTFPALQTSNNLDLQESSSELINRRAKARAILSTLVPVTLQSQDREGSLLQIWKKKDKDIFLGIVTTREKTIFIAGCHIQNALQPQENGVTFLLRIALTPPKKWSLIFKNNRMIVWPHLIAAAKDGEWVKPRWGNSSQIGHMFRPPKPHLAEKHWGHLIGDTPENRALVERAIASKENYVGTDNDGNDIYLARHPDGSQSWAEVRNGVITNGGVNGQWKDFTHWNSRFDPDLKKNLRWHRRFFSLDKIDLDQKGLQNRKKEESKRLADLTDGVAKRRFGNGTRPGGGPGLKALQELLQQTKLVSSYNSAHPHNQMPEGNARGEIGGVACSSSYIKDLFNDPKSLFEKDHYFVFPALSNGSFPFTDIELKQILRELAIGVYTHSTIPFFSLHFREAGSDLFPVIHPAYENTLVGRVIGMLDYIMKGYLNGGVYKEDFIDKWHQEPMEARSWGGYVQSLFYNPFAAVAGYFNKQSQEASSPKSWYENPDWKRKEAFAIKELIDFSSYCETEFTGEDSKYISLAELSSVIPLDPTLPKALQSFSGFKNSFRIIAKQNSIQKEENCFTIDGDFDVFYDINPSPEYKQALDEYVRIHGAPPASHSTMEQFYQLMTQRIHDHMAKMPICRSYFSMLSIMNFFAGYFSTLKAHRKMPSLPVLERPLTKGCPSLFPYLPVSLPKEIEISVNLHKVAKECLQKNNTLIQGYFNGLFKHILDSNRLLFEPETKTRILAVLNNELTAQALQPCDPPVRRYVEKNKDNFNMLKLATEILEVILKTFTENAEQVRAELTKPRSFFEPKMKSISQVQQESGPIVQQVLSAIVDALPNSEQKILKTKALSVVHLPHETLQADNKVRTRVVGGCGLKMETQEIQTSFLAKGILQRNVSTMLNLAPETLTLVRAADDLPRVMFRLSIQNIEPYEESIFSNLETSLFISPKSSAEKTQLFMQAKQAMEIDDQTTFSSLISSTSQLNEIKDSTGKTLLHLAAAIPDLFYTQKLLEKNADKRAKDAQGYLPVHYAAMGSNKLILELLLDINTINAASYGGVTPLIVAIQHHQIENVRLLLSKNATITLLASGYTALHCALHEGNEEIISAMLNAPHAVQHINVNSIEGGTPLMLACCLDRLDLVQRLLALGANASIARQCGETAIEISIKRNSLAILNVLLEKAKPTPVALEIAAQIGDAAIIEKLLPFLYEYQNGSNENALHIAIRYGNQSGSLILIEKCKEKEFLEKKNRKQESPCDLAIAFTSWDVIHALFKADVEINFKALVTIKYRSISEEFFEGKTFSQSALQEYALLAARSGNFEWLSLALAPMGLDFAQIPGPLGLGVLYYLAKSDGLFLIRYLLAQVAGKEKMIAAIAAESGSRTVLKFLLAKMKKENISPADALNGKHLLYYAILGDMDTMVLEAFNSKELASCVIDSANNLRPAHLAAKIGSKQVLQRLHSYQADLTSQDAKEWTPLDYALQSEEEEAISFLLENGAPVTAISLYQSATQSSTKSFKLLIHRNQNADVLDEALMRAVQGHNLLAFERLLSSGARPSFCTQEGWTPLLFACKTGQTTILQALVPRLIGIMQSFEGNGPLHLAAKYKHGDCVDFLLLAGYKDYKNSQGKTAKQLGGKEMQFAFEQEKTSIGSQFTTLLQNENLQELQELISSFPINRSITIDLGNQQAKGTLLQLWLRFGRCDGVSLFLQELLKNPEIEANQVDDKGDTLAHLLIKKNISPLILDKVDLTVTNHLGLTPIHEAAAYASASLMTSLIEVLNHKNQLFILEKEDHQGFTPLFYAVIREKEEVIDVLLKQRVRLEHLSHTLLSPLCLACAKGSLPIVQKLYSGGADLNQRVTSQRTTVLQLATEGKNTVLIQYLLSHGADPLKATMQGTPLIHKAVQMEDETLFRLLQAQDVYMNEEDNRGIFPKHAAAIKGSTKMLNMTLSLDKRPLNAPALLQMSEDSSVKQEMTLLELSCLGGHPEIAAHLLKLGAVPRFSSEKESALTYAASSRASSALFPLLEEYPLRQNSEQVRLAIVQAIRSDNVDAMKQLYQNDIPIDRDLLPGYTGAHIACMRGSLLCTSWLLLQKANFLIPSPSGETALELAAVNDSHEQFDLLLRYLQPDLTLANRKWEILLHFAAKAGKIGHVLSLLMHHQTLLDEQDCAGCTPLYYAAAKGHTDVVSLLLSMGADPSIRSLLKQTPEDVCKDAKTQAIMNQWADLQASRTEDTTLLHLAVQNGCFLAVRFFTQALDLEELDLQNEKGQSALHLAVQSRQKEMIFPLLQAGVNVNLQDNQGRTCLWMAYLRDLELQPDFQIIEQLISAGADVTLTDNSGKTLLEYIRDLNEPLQKKLLEFLNHCEEKI